MKQPGLLRARVATPVDSARPKSGFVVGNGQDLARLWIGQRRKLRQEFEAALADGFGQVAFMIRKVREWRRGRTLLPLKEHRNLRPEQQQRDQCPPSPGLRQLMQSDAAAGVGHLVMILEEADEGGARTGS